MLQVLLEHVETTCTAEKRAVIPQFLCMWCVYVEYMGAGLEFIVCGFCLDCHMAERSEIVQERMTSADDLLKSTEIPSMGLVAWESGPLERRMALILLRKWNARGLQEWKTTTSLKGLWIRASRSCCHFYPAVLSWTWHNQLICMNVMFLWHWI